jgi:hypothetical protein
MCISRQSRVRYRVEGLIWIAAARSWPVGVKAWRR